MKTATKRFDANRVIGMGVLCAMLSTLVYLMLMWSPAYAATYTITIAAPVPPSVLSTFAMPAGNPTTADSIQFLNNSGGSKTVTITPVNAPDATATTLPPVNNGQTVSTTLPHPGTYALACGALEGCTPSTLEVVAAPAQTSSPSSSSTATASASPSPSPSATCLLPLPQTCTTPSPSAPASASASASPTASVSPTASPTASPSASPTVSPSPSPSVSPTVAPSPSPSPSEDPEFEREVSLSLVKHLRAKGKVTSESEAPSECTNNVPVEIQRKTKSGWVGLKSTQTDDSGRYSVRLRDKKGRYRAAIGELIENDVLVCLSDRSGVEAHKRHKK